MARAEPAGTAVGTAEGEVDLTFLHLMELLSGAVLAASDNYCERDGEGVSAGRDAMDGRDRSPPRCCSPE